MKLINCKANYETGREINCAIISNATVSGGAAAERNYLLVKNMVTFFNIQL